MPFANVNGTRLFYRLEGSVGRPVLIFSHSIGTDSGMWTPQAADMSRHFQILRYDTRGHGASDAPAGEYSMEVLGRDVMGLADALNELQKISRGIHPAILTRGGLAPAIKTLARRCPAYREQARWLRRHGQTLVL